MQVIRDASSDEREIQVKNSIKFRASSRLLVVMGMLLALLTACSSAPTPAASGILEGSAQTVTLDQIKQAIDDIYTRHPDINSFSVQAVTYNPTTRDKVLKICSEGGLAANEQEREAQKVMACAPLIFFFNYYGQQKSVPESIDLARQLYWYAVADKSDNSKKVLTDLLKSWGIQ
jgi:hypothetical protein